MKKQINRNKDIILLTIGTLLIILSLCLMFYDRVELVKSNVFADIEMQKYRENNNGEEKSDDNLEVDNAIITDDAIYEIDEMDDENEEKAETPKKQSESLKQKIAKEFIGYIEIEKINLKQGLVSKKSFYNKLYYNIQILSASSYPDQNMGNVILASHSGTSPFAYFRNLYLLEKGDEAKIYYKKYIYTYKIVDIYNVPKTGKVRINRDIHKTCLTLITCTHNSKTEQTVYILELIDKVKDGK